MKISLKNIKTDVDYDELVLFESHLTHELHRMSDEEFIEKYKNIDTWCDSYEKKVLLISILEYMGYAVNVDFEPTHIILDFLDYLSYKDDELTEKDLNILFENSIEEFRANGLFYDDFGGFADGTYYRRSVH